MRRRTMRRARRKETLASDGVGALLRRKELWGECGGERGRTRMERMRVRMWRGRSRWKKLSR
eukprot:6528124-Pyramimonas_sp.AAC.1